MYKELHAMNMDNTAKSVFHLNIQRIKTLFIRMVWLLYNN